MLYRYSWSGACIVVFLIVLTCEVVSSQDNGYMLTLEHSFGNGDFYKRGEIHFQNIRGETATVLKQNSLTAEESTLLEDLSKTNGLYRIRVQSKLPGVSSNVENEETTTTWIISFTYAKKLLEASLSHLITIHTDGLGNIIAINIIPSDESSYFDPDAIEFDVEVNVVLPSQAPVPDTHGYLNKLEEERRKKEISAKEPTSFLGKYWMYIVPVVIFMMMSNAGQQQ